MTLRLYEMLKIAIKPSTSPMMTPMRTAAEMSARAEGRGASPRSPMVAPQPAWSAS
jgi:hypothetical protein